MGIFSLCGGKAGQNEEQELGKVGESHLLRSRFLEISCLILDVFLRTRLKVFLQTKILRCLCREKSWKG